MEGLYESGAGVLGAFEWTGGAVGGCGACCLAVFVGPFFFPFLFSKLPFPSPFSLRHFSVAIFNSRQSSRLLSSNNPPPPFPPKTNNPNRAQGAATALEDAYILGKLFANRALSSSPIPSSLSTPTDIPTLLAHYSTLRKPRADRLTAASATTRDFDHLVDGPKQVERDERLRGMRMRDGNAALEILVGDGKGVGLEEVGKDGEGKGWGDCWLDRGFQSWLFGEGGEGGCVEGVVGRVDGFAAWD